MEEKKDLLTLIFDESWDKVLKRINSHPDETKSWDEHGDLPIHSALKRSYVPINIVQTLVNVYPNSLKEKSTFCGQSILPLHVAVSHLYKCQPDVIQYLLDNYIESASITNECGQTPLIIHLHCNPLPDMLVVKILIYAYANAVQLCDDRLWYPLHHAVQSSNGNREVLEYIIELYPEALFKKNDENMTPRDIANELVQGLKDAEEQYFCASNSEESSQSLQGSSSNELYNTEKYSVSGVNFQYREDEASVIAEVGSIHSALTPSMIKSEQPQKEVVNNIVENYS